MLFPGAEYDSDLVNKIGLLSKAEHTISVVTQDGFDSFTSGLDTSDIGKTAKGIFLIQTFSHGKPLLEYNISTNTPLVARLVCDF